MTASKMELKIRKLKIAIIITNLISLLIIIGLVIVNSFDIYDVRKCIL